MNIHFEPVRWSLNASIYEVNLRQYTPEGTFQAFERELPRLRDMGVTILWFMPVTPIGREKRIGSLGSYYAASSYTETNPEFGTVKDFRALVAHAHQLGFRVIIDWVANHTAWDHPWTTTHPGFYKRNQRGEFYDAHGWNDVIDLNYYDHALRKEMIRSMEFWVKECDIDGFRCDMAHLVPLDFWRDARRALDAVKPLFWLAETEQQNYQHVFDCSYAWHWLHLTQRAVRDRSGADELRRALVEYQKKKLPQTTHLFFTSNHDENSWNGTEYERYGPAALCLAVFACTWNGIALVYSGQELPNHKRLQFFEKDPIAWTGKYELHSFYKTLLDLRAGFGEEQTDILMLQTSGDHHVLAFLKISRLRQVLVLLNFSDAAQSAHVDESIVSGVYRDVFTGKKQEASSRRDLLMEPWAYLVLEQL